MYVKCFVDAYFSDEFYNRVMGLYVYTRVHKQNKRQIRISKITDYRLCFSGVTKFAKS